MQHWLCDQLFAEASDDLHVLHVIIEIECRDDRIEDRIRNEDAAHASVPVLTCQHAPDGCVRVNAVGRFFCSVLAYSREPKESASFSECRAVAFDLLRENLPCPAWGPRIVRSSDVPHDSSLTRHDWEGCVPTVLVHEKAHIVMGINDEGISVHGLPFPKGGWWDLRGEESRGMQWMQGQHPARKHADEQPMRGGELQRQKALF